MTTFSRAEVTDALEQLADELTARNISAHIRIVGGAAVVLAHDQDRPATRDVDALDVRPKEQVLEAAAAIAARNSWSYDWLNTGVQMFAPDPDHPEPAWETYLRRGDVLIEVATARFLLAMKLHAARGRRDTEDIEVLVARCELTSMDEVRDLFERHYSAELLSDRSIATLERIFD